MSDEVSDKVFMRRLADSLVAEFKSPPSPGDTRRLIGMVKIRDARIEELEKMEKFVDWLSDECDSALQRGVHICPHSILKKIITQIDRKGGTDE